MLTAILRELLEATPFTPFVLHFKDGFALEIHDPHQVDLRADDIFAVLTPHAAHPRSRTFIDYATYLDARDISRLVTTTLPPALARPVTEPPAPAKTRVLFICIHNSARSQMAEAFLRELGGDRFEAASAGIDPQGVHPLAVRVMAEAGLDIAGARSKSVFELFKAGALFNYAITVCEESREGGPVFPGYTHRLHWSLPDPVEDMRSEEENLARFRTMRDAIRARVEQWSLAHTP
jgi:arsenate reductase (thioredoxin)